jgi:hypothetical protein
MDGLAAAPADFEFVGFVGDDQSAFHDSIRNDVVTTG